MKKIALFFSSVCYLGYIKHAPGTFGSLAGILLWAFFMPDKFIVHFISLIAIFFISLVVSHFAEAIYGVKDDQRIVIDEVAGVWFSVAFIHKTVLLLILGFLLFRLFDITKPWIIKRAQNARGGFGVTIDDVLAGIFVNCILQIINACGCYFVK